MVVPRPGAPETLNEPFRNSTRSRIPRRPSEVGALISSCVMPLPLSVITSETAVSVNYEINVDCVSVRVHGDVSQRLLKNAEESS